MIRDAGITNDNFKFCKLKIVLENSEMDKDNKKHELTSENKETVRETSESKNELTMKGIKKSRYKEKCICFLKSVTVEPVLGCYVLPSMLMYLVIQNLHLEKACRVNLHYGEEVCDRIINQDVANLTEEVQNVQRLVAQMQVWKTPLQTTLPAILIIFVGSWSDRTGRRKPGMMVPLLGDFTVCIGSIVSVYYFLEWPLEISALIEAIPPALCGGFAILLCSSYSYLSDITTRENRTFRLGMLNIVTVIAMPIGQALSGILIKYIGYYGVLSIIGTFLAFGFLYTWIRIKEHRIIEPKVETTGSCGLLDFFNPRCISDTFTVVLKPRAGNKRIELIVLAFMIVLANGPLYGELAVMYLFSRYKFNFTEIDYSFYGTYSSIMHILGTVIAIGILNRRFNVNDYWLGILSGSSKILASFVFAFAPTVTWFYMGPLVDCFSGYNVVIVKALTSKFVEPHEIGRLYSIIGVLEALSPTIYSPMYNKVYVYTLDYFPGAFFFLGALSAFPVVLTYAIVYISHRKDLGSSTPGDKGCGVREKRGREERQNKEMYAYDNQITAM